MSEDEHTLLRRLPATLGPTTTRVLVGIGDDAAVLAPGDLPLVWTIDAAVEGVHFTRDLLAMRDVGYRSYAAAASDLAAMGARPVAALSALILPATLSGRDVDDLMQGQAEAAEAFGAPVVGGNVSRGSELSVTTTLFGEAARPVRRQGARPGDGVWLCGEVGLSAAGLAALTAGRGDEPALAAAVLAFRRPRSRVLSALAAADRASAGVDVSDGLAQDCEHVARASGVAIELSAEALLAASGAALEVAARELGADALALALAGGEDYAVVFTAAASLAAAGFVRIGTVVDGPPAVRVLQGGAPIDVPRGFDHRRA